MKRLIATLILMAITSLAIADPGYVSGKNYFNSWSTTGSTGTTIATGSYTALLNIDTIVVSGSVDATMVIYVNGYVVRRYSFLANQTVGEYLLHPIILPIGGKFIAIIQSGASGTFNVSIGGYL